MDFVFSFVLLSYKLADLCNSLFLVDVLEFSIYEIIVSGNRNGFTSSISIYVHFISHYYKIALARTSSITLNRRGKIRLPCLFIILGKSIRHVGYGIYADIFCQVQGVSLYTWFVEYTYDERVLNFAKCLFCSY